MFMEKGVVNDEAKKELRLGILSLHFQRNRCDNLLSSFTFAALIMCIAIEQFFSEVTNFGS